VQKTPELAQPVLDRGTRETVAQASRQRLHRFGDAGLRALQTVRLVRDHDGKVARGEIVDIAPDRFEARNDCQGAPSARTQGGLIDNAKCTHRCPSNRDRTASRPAASGRHCTSPTSK
jgi:hypothetical protein